MINRKKQAVCQFWWRKKFFSQSWRRVHSRRTPESIWGEPHSAWPSRNKMRPNEVALEYRPVSFGQKCVFLTLFYHFAHSTSRWTVCERLTFFEFCNLGGAFLKKICGVKEKYKTCFFGIYVFEIKLSNRP